MIIITVIIVIVVKFFVDALVLFSIVLLLVVFLQLHTQFWTVIAFRLFLPVGLPDIFHIPFSLGWCAWQWSVLTHLLDSQRHELRSSTRLHWRVAGKWHLDTAWENVYNSPTTTTTAAAVTYTR